MGRTMAGSMVRAALSSEARMTNTTMVYPTWTGPPHHEGRRIFIAAKGLRSVRGLRLGLLGINRVGRW